MINIKTNDRIFIAGRTGTGKTNFAKKRLLQLYPRKIFHDAKLENSDLLANNYLCRTPNELKDSLVVNRTSILYQPKTLGEEDYNEICKLIYYKGNYALFTDEASLYSSPSSIPEWTRELLVRGRSRGIGMVNLSQRPRMVNTNLISEAEHLIVFTLSMDTDIEKVRNFIPKEYREMIPRLPDFHFIYAHNGDAILHKPIA